MPSRPVRSRLSGPATRAGAAQAGVTAWRLRHKDVVRLSRDTYLPKAVQRDLRARVAAVLLTAPPEAVVSHATAAALWGIAIPMRPDDARIHVTVATGSAVRDRSDRRIHRIPLAADEIVLRGGIHLTTPQRTWRDLAAHLPPAALLAVADQCLDGRCSVDDLAQQLAVRPSGRGSARARAVLPVADPRAESPMESVLRWLVHEAGLPTPALQFVVRNGEGQFLGRADLAWPDLKVLVEFDGDGHRDRDVFVDDLRRQNRLIAAGWIVLRFSSADVLGNPDRVIAEIQAALCR